MLLQGRQLVLIGGMAVVLIGALTGVLVLRADRDNAEADAVWVEEKRGIMPEEKVYTKFHGGKVRLAPLLCDKADGYGDRCLPHAAVAGFPKGGTAQLNAALGACHPQVLSSHGELNMRTQSTHVLLHRLETVEEGDDLLAFGSSPIVSLMKSAELNFMKELIPHLKLIFLLREPAARDYSHFKMHIRHNDFHVPYPPRCFNDTSECMYNLVMDHVVARDAVWSTCAGLSLAERELLADQELNAIGRKLGGLDEYDDEEWSDLLHWDDFVPQEKWEECIVKNTNRK